MPFRMWLNSHFSYYHYLINAATFLKLTLQGFGGCQKPGGNFGLSIPMAIWRRMNLCRQRYRGMPYLAWSWNNSWLLPLWRQCSTAEIKFIIWGVTLSLSHTRTGQVLDSFFSCPLWWASLPPLMDQPIPSDGLAHQASPCTSLFLVHVCQRAKDLSKVLRDLFWDFISFDKAKYHAIEIS